MTAYTSGATAAPTKATISSASTATACFFFFNDPATTEIYTLSLHDALPISRPAPRSRPPSGAGARAPAGGRARAAAPPRSEEHTSELQSRVDLVCRLLL